MTVEDRAVDGSNTTAAEHVRQYLESAGASVDHPAQGHLIILYTTGRVSGDIRRTPLRFFEDGEGLIVAASYRGSPDHPDWYLNLLDDPHVWVRKDSDLFPARSVVIEDDERDRIWDTVVAIAAPQFVEYQANTTRVIPLVRLLPSG